MSGIKIINKTLQRHLRYFSYDESKCYRIENDKYWDRQLVAPGLAREQHPKSPSEAVTSVPSSSVIALMIRDSDSSP